MKNGMNKLKTFFYYLGAIIISNIGIAILVFSSNKIFENLPDVFFVPTKAIALGYLPFVIAASVALNTTKNYDRTLKILWRWKLTIASLYCFFGLFQLIFGFYYGLPLFEFNEEVSVFSQPNHWLYNIPIGLSGLFAGYQIKKDNINIF